MQATSPARSNIHNSTVWKTHSQQVPAARAVHSKAPIRVCDPAAWHTLNTEPVKHSASSQVLGLQHVHASGQPPMRMCGSIQHAVMTCRRPAHHPIPSRTPSRHAMMDACMHVDWQSSISAHCLQRAWHYVTAACHGPWVMQPRPHSASRVHMRTGVMSGAPGRRAAARLGQSWMDQSTESRRVVMVRVWWEAPNNPSSKAGSLTT